MSNFEHEQNSKYTVYSVLACLGFWCILGLEPMHSLLGMMLVIWFSESKSNHWFTWVSVTIAPFLFIALILHIARFPTMYNTMVLTVFVLFATEVNMHLTNFTNKMFQIET